MCHKIIFPRGVSIFFSLAAILCTFAPTLADNPPALPSPQRINVGSVDSICGIRTAPGGNLVVLVTQAKAINILLISPDGRQISSTPVPPEIAHGINDPWRCIAAADREGNFYFLHPGDSKIWMLPSGSAARSIDFDSPVNSFAIASTSDGEYLDEIGATSPGLRIHIPDQTRKQLILAGDGLTALHVAASGDLYGYGSDQLIWHFSPDGKLIGKIGGGGAPPPNSTLPGEFVTPQFDVAPSGDVYWTTGDYGAVTKFSADGNQAVRIPGGDPSGQRWTSPFFQIAGLAISGDSAYVVGGTIMTRFPLSMIAPGMPGVAVADPRVYGLNYLITSPQPYKLYLTPTVPLSALFEAGNRATHQINLQYTVYDLWQKIVAGGTEPLQIPGNAQVTIPLPAINLPRLGWYRVDTAIALADGTILGKRTNFIGRTFVDPRLPIPPKEVSGWNDLDTHKMVGMGLHRFAANQINDITTYGPAVAEAKKLQVPYFFQLTNKPDVTPANVRLILSNQPDLQRLEIMNEPDQQGVSPEDYVNNYLKPCSQEAHRINPRIMVMGPTKCGIELQWMDRFFKAGGGNYVDIVSVHTYERNNSMDAYHWSWKLQTLKEMMAQYGCGNKPLYQTEHGYMGNFHNFIQRPQWQARSLFEEYLTCDHFGIGPAQFMYYYVNEGGFADFSAEIVDGDRELYPAALLMRTRARILEGTHYDSAFDLGPVGNWLVQANRYAGAVSDVLILMNTGAYKDIDLAIDLPPSARIYDCWGNPSSQSARSGHVAVGMYPTYILVPRGSPVTMKMPWSEQNIAPEATFAIADAKAQPDVGKLTNGELEFDFHDEPDRQGMIASDDHLPLDLTATWPSPRTINHVILYGNLSDNQYCTPTAYTLEARVNGNWQALDQIHVPTEGNILNIGSITRVTSYANPWIFTHDFAPVTADAIRFHFTGTTFGQYPTREIVDSMISAYHWGPIPAGVQIRELQVFSPSGH